MKTARTCFTTWAETLSSAPPAKHPSSSRNRSRSQSQSSPPGGPPARSPSLFQSRCTLTSGLGRFFSSVHPHMLCSAQVPGPRIPYDTKLGMAGAPVHLPPSIGSGECPHPFISIREGVKPVGVPKPPPPPPGPPSAPEPPPIQVPPPIPVPPPNPEPPPPPPA